MALTFEEELWRAARFMRCEPLEARPSQHDWLLIHGAGRLRKKSTTQCLRELRTSIGGSCNVAMGINGDQWEDEWKTGNYGNISCFSIEQSQGQDVSWKKHLDIYQEPSKSTSTLELAICNPGIFCWPPSRSSRSATQSRNPPALGVSNRSWQVKAMNARNIESSGEHPKLKTWVTMSRPLEKHTLGKTNMQIIFLWYRPLHKCPVPRRPRIEWAGSRKEVHSALLHRFPLWPYKTCKFTSACISPMQLHAFL